MVDLTTLEGADTPGKVRALAAKADAPRPGRPDLPAVAAVCVYPDLVAHGRRTRRRQRRPGRLRRHRLPRGPRRPRRSSSPTPATRSRPAPTRSTWSSTAARSCSGHYRQVFERDRRGQGRVRARTADAHLKVILETGELATYDNVRRASLARDAGRRRLHQDLHRQGPAGRDAAGHAGDARGGPRLPRRHRPQVGVKPAGGIRTTKDAIKYLVIVNEVAGPEWLDPHWFRFGASTLLNDLLMQRHKMTHRRYSGPTTSRWTEDMVSTSRLPPSSTPRPPSRAASSTSGPPTASSSTASSSPGTGTSFKTVNPATEEVLAEVAEASDADVDRAVTAARRAYDTVWARMPGAERAKYLFRIARIIQERARELAVLESLDNGKPIRESRDVDVPPAAAHFFYYAGWADKLSYAGFGAEPRPLGVAAQVIPWNFPLLMLAWKIAPALACGNTVVLKPAETTPLTALLLRRDLPAGRPARRASSTSSPARAPPARRSSSTRASTRSRSPAPPRSASPSRARRRHRQAGHARAGRQGRQHRLRRRAARPGRRGHRQRHLLQPGPRLLRGLAPAGAGVRRRGAARPRSSAGWTRCASATRSTRTPTSARSTPPSSSRRIRELSDVGEAEGAERWSPALRAARATATGSRRRSSPASPRRTGSPARRSSARCCRCSRSARRTRRSRRPTTRRTACRPASGPTRARGSCRWPASCGPAWCGPTPSTGSTRPAPSAATRSPGYGREGGRHGLAAYLR